MGPVASSAATTQEIIIGIGGVPILVRSDSPEFVRILERRYVGFVDPNARPIVELDVEIVPPRLITDEDDISVRFRSGKWLIERNDLRAELEPELRRGRVIQSANPYAIDTVLRIIHSLVLARTGGLLVHAASGIRNGKAFLFSGVSGAGKTRLSLLPTPPCSPTKSRISAAMATASWPMARPSPESWPAPEKTSAPHSQPSTFCARDRRTSLSQ
jgi:hypothetical protein